MSADERLRLLRRKLEPIESGPGAHPPLPRKAEEGVSQRGLNLFDYWFWKMNNFSPEDVVLGKIMFKGAVPTDWTPSPENESEVVGLALARAIEQEGTTDAPESLGLITKVLQGAQDPKAAADAALNYARVSKHFSDTALDLFTSFKETPQE